MDQLIMELIDVYKDEFYCLPKNQLINLHYKNNKKKIQITIISPLFFL